MGLYRGFETLGTSQSAHSGVEYSFPRLYRFRGLAWEMHGTFMIKWSLCTSIWS